MVKSMQKNEENISYGIRDHGDAGQLVKLEGNPLAPAAGEAVVAHHAIGLNFIDTYQRSGLYPVPLPAVLGMEGAGVVEEIGAEVTHLKTGDRVVYAGALGGYSTRRVIDAQKLVKLPSSIDMRIAAASMLRGMTVEYLITRTYPVQAGDFVLFHAAAGGVGQIALQWLKRIGAQTIAIVSTDEKAAIAKNLGAAHVIIGRDSDIVAAVKDITNGEGVKVVYDSVGEATFIKSLDCLVPRGMMVSYGNASGPVSSFSLGELAKRGSLFVTRPSLMHYTSTRAELELSAARWFDQLEQGIEVSIGLEAPLSEVASAHRTLESGTVMGASVLIPN